MPEDLDHRAVRPDEVEAAAIGTDPKISTRVFGDRRHIGRGHRTRLRAVRQLSYQPGAGIEYVGPAAVGADPNLAGAGLENRHDAGRAQTVRIARLDGDGLDAAVRSQFPQSVRHGAYPH